MKVQEVKGRMVAKGIEAEKLAKAMKMNPSTFYRKMKNNGQDFTVGDLQVMKAMLGLTDSEAVDILIYS